MISVDEAYEQYAATVPPLPAEAVSVAEALHRVLTTDVTSRIDLPPFEQSAMDGYALRAADTAGAIPERPACLRLVGTSAAGRLARVPELGSEEAVRIFTGGHVPVGADAILRQEDARVDGDDLVVDRPLAVGHDLRHRGEELAEGAVIARAGTRLTPGLVGALAVAGVDRPRVLEQPRITVLTTGDEVVPPGQPLQTGEVYDANGPLVVSWLRSFGYRHVHVIHLPDDLARTTRVLGDALSQSDLVITTGGVSVGERDYVIPAARGAGAEEIFWRVKQKPGKPLFLGKRDSTPLIGLPGNPGAVFVSLDVHVRRVLDLLEGVREPQPRFLGGVLAFSVRADATRERWLRCRVEIEPDGAVSLTELPRQASHMISNLAHCTALARIPAGAGTLAAGTAVAWTPCGGAVGELLPGGETV